MAGPQKNGVNGAMAEQKESSVLFSLKELMSIEENRIREEEDAKKRRAEEEVQARAQAEQRARDEEERRLKDEDERRRQEELRRKMEEAQIEAAKSAEIEKRKLEEQHRLQMEALARQQAHEKEIHVIQSQKRKGIHPGILAGIGVALVGALIAVIYFTAIVPKNQAKEAIARADNFAQSSDESDWSKADQELAIAKDKDPQNADIKRISDKVNEKRTKAAADRKAKEDERDKLLVKLQQDLKDANDALSNAHSEAEIAAAKAKIADTNKKITGLAPAGPKATAKPPCVCPPGVPLCSC
jgi:colicin import membrane protein